MVEKRLVDRSGHYVKTFFGQDRTFPPRKSWTDPRSRARALSRSGEGDGEGSADRTRVVAKGRGIRLDGKAQATGLRRPRPSAKGCEANYMRAGRQTATWHVTERWRALTHAAGYRLTLPNAPFSIWTCTQSPRATVTSSVPSAFAAATQRSKARVSGYMT